MKVSHYPSLYQINTRVRHRRFCLDRGGAAGIDDWPDSEWQGIAEQGFDWLWLLGVWQTGQAGAQVSRSHEPWQQGFQASLADLSEDDICGSCFAVTSYRTAEYLGGDKALAGVRKKLNEQGLKLMLDFVPNHTALDHPWVREHPEFYIQGSNEDLERELQNYIELESKQGKQVFAYGRDPYFDGWPDTLQLDYSNPKVQESMIAELLAVAERCDGVRCDMAMLILPEVFDRTWGKSIEPFWPKAIAAVRERFPDFVLLAEVYWDLEWTLQQQGFDFTYDKRLYDRLRDRVARPVREHLVAGLDFQSKLARFLENHDEPRAAHTFPPEVHEAAAIVTFLSPGLRFFHDGQLTGNSVHIPIHLCRGPEETADQRLSEFYSGLLQTLQRPVFRSGEWALADCRPAEDGNESWRNFIGYRWRSVDETVWVAVNYAAQPGQCRLEGAQIPKNENNTQVLLSSQPQKPGVEMNEEGIRFDFPAWGYRVFTLPD
ncbi:alpha-amylase family glycosyl hydrolase [Methylotuvimicrobium alcaliphilum]|uniref:D-Glucan glucanohydrolase (Alpha amylase) n=1 Tax=Methylotuvimicrobium alcaliphilum (strain DSM 19304 / NCIMB 14124 / VKM B-2133 / 20Z) TaxID=1091494 RepID=G4T088_META2|nr:alpha-amylase family glycosyl hydrolase [Methylotuvimicrobium alcaliphilum]CCE23378.1 D-Glucan glucanohydrolase (alpha amylase) [Methylotuvimicrobium alcaliphilum 20Z]